MTKPSAWRWPASRTPTTELRAWLAHAYTQLAPVSEDAALEAHLLAAHILEQSRTWIVAHPDAVLEKIHQQQLDSLLERLVRREPLPYLTGKVDFFGMTFEVSPSVLIPRPETELLVDTALTWLRDHPKQRRAVDVGTGSGAIAIALAVHVPDLAVVGVDLSRQALQVARRNIWRHQVSQRVNLVHSDLLAGVCAPFDLLCANLPYIPTQTLASLDVARFEPWMALDGGTDGLRLVERLLGQMIDHFKDRPGSRSPHPEGEGGKMALFEIEAGQGESVLELAKQYLWGASCQILSDLAGNARLLVIDLS